MSIVNETRLKQYLKCNYNVLLEGYHGIGKTAIISKMFDEAGYKYKFFTCSNLDPWVDLVGVPKMVEKNGISQIELIRPEVFANDDLDAIFFDELNRAPPKVLNAIMELIQFKSINGHRFNKLKVVWAAMNPKDDEDTYSVNYVDPAQLDRFHVHIDVPYKLDEDYLFKKYGSTCNSFISWWKDLPEDTKFKVSPRRLDYAIDAYKNDCRLEDFLPNVSNVKKLRDLLKSSPFIDQIKAISTKEEATKFLSNLNNATKLLDLVKNDSAEAVDFFKNNSGVLPKELVDAIGPIITTKTNGLTIVDSFETFVKNLPETAGNNTIIKYINEVDFSLLYKSGGNFEDDLRACQITNKSLIKKLSVTLRDVIMNSQIRTIGPALFELVGNTLELDHKKQTNFCKILKLLGSLDYISKYDKKQINDKLYQKLITTQMNFV